MTHKQIRVPDDVHQALRLIAVRRRVPLTRLASQVLSDFAFNYLHREDRPYTFENAMAAQAEARRENTAAMNELSAVLQAGADVRG